MKVARTVWMGGREDEYPYIHWGKKSFLYPYKGQSFLNRRGLGNLESPRFPKPVRFRKPKTGKV